MSVLPIRIWPDSVLRQKAFPIDDEKLVAGEYDSLVSDMFDTLYDAGGVGLAAPQVGVLLRIFVMDCGEPCVFYNPVAEGEGQTVEVQEGCLSLPGIRERVSRHSRAHVTSRTRRDGAATDSVYEFTGLAAQCAQHETEHLDGIVMLDRLSMSAGERRRYEAWLKKERRAK